MPIIPARRTENIIYAIRNIVNYAKELEKQGQKILYLNIGDPIAYDFSTPAHMIENTYKSMKKGLNGYAHSYGLEEARRAILSDEESKGKKVALDDIIVCSGASEAIEMALTALLNKEDNVLLPVPGYPLYQAVVAKLGANSKPYQLDWKNDWQVDLTNLEKQIDKHTKALVVINPNNPTGAVYSEKTLKGILDICEKHKLLLFSDEIYDKLLFDSNKMTYFSNLSKNVPIISFNGISKNYVAPGWRIGWLTFQNMDEETNYKAAVKRIAEARLCAPAPFQGAVKEALTGDQSHLAEVKEKLQRRRDITFERLSAMKRVSIVKPKATFYAMPVVEGIEDDEAFIKDLLRKTGVLFVHGSGFGMDKKLGSFRIVFLPDEDTLNQAYDHLEKYLS